MGERCLRGGEGLREGSGMRWCGGEEEREGGDGGRSGGDRFGGRRGMVGRQRVVYCRKRVGSKAAGLVGKAEGVQIAAPVEGVDIGHHGGGPMECGPIVHEEFLGPATELVAGSLLGGNGLDGIAVADPVEVAAPDVGVDDGEAPSAGCNFANKRVVVGLGGGAPAGCHEDGLQAGGGKVLDQSEGGLEGVEGLQEVGGPGQKGPGQKGDGFAMIGANECAEGSNAGFKVGNESGVEGEEADEGVERLATGGYGPVADRVVFGGGRAVAIRAEVVADPFDAVEEEVALLGVEGEAPFGEDMADAHEVEE
eukprot:scaffold5536_cov186-Amphora_coffeaeformis.AAC.2